MANGVLEPNGSSAMGNCPEKIWYYPKGTGGSSGSSLDPEPSTVQLQF